MTIICFRRRVVLPFILLFFILRFGFSQDYKLSGNVVDRTTQQPLIGANVIITNTADSTSKFYAITNAEGAFSLNKLKKGEYRLSASFIGYNKSEQIVSVAFRDQSVGNIFLLPKVEQLESVTITGSPPQAVLKGDTTEFNAAAFKVTPDANVEDLVKKMPGVTVEDGTVKAQGEEVKKVLVDGKPFFGDDPAIALRNLPAEIIEKVQVFDQQSEQSQLTGFNDGQTSKTMNIVTRNDRRNGQFGRLTAAYGNNDRYNINLNMNTFKGSQRLSAIISTNNINQQNFMTQDFLGAMGGSGFFGNRDAGASSGRQGGFGGGSGRQGQGSNRMVSQGTSFLSAAQNGISNINSIGLNYSNTFKEKLTISGSYFLNNNRNENNQLSNTEYILNVDSSSFEYLNTNSITRNFNNRLNFRLEWSIDSMNTVIVIPSVNFQSNKSNTGNIETQSLSYLETIYPQTASDYLSNSKTNGYNISNRFIYRHKFGKTGRTISADLNTAFNERTPYSSSISDVDYIISGTSVLTNRLSTTMNSGYSFNTNIAYSEPTGKYGIIQINVANSYARTYAYKRTSDLDPLYSGYLKIDTLSNKYLNFFITNRVGLTYRLKGTKYVASAGAELQNANLSGDQTYPKKSKTKKYFVDILPNAQLNYRVTQQHNVILNYNTSVNPPSISQLQNVAVYASNLTRVTIGNPDLEPQYQHNISTRLVYVNRAKGSNFFILFGGTVSENSIGNSTLYKDTIQITMPVNRGTGYNFRSMINYGFALKAIKCNLNISGGYNYNKTPGSVNGKENIAITNTLIQSVVLSSNISEKLDFTISTNGNFNIVSNSVNPENNSNYYSQLSNARLNWTFWKGISLQSELSNRLYNGMSSSNYNQNITIVNLGLGKKFLKNQAAEFRLMIYDMLNKNTTISRTISENQITDQQSLALSRYFLFSFIYTFRNFKSNEKTPGIQQRGGFDGPPPMPMGPPPGMP